MSCSVSVVRELLVKSELLVAATAGLACSKSRLTKPMQQDQSKKNTHLEYSKGRVHFRKLSILTKVQTKIEIPTPPATTLNAMNDSRESQASGPVSQQLVLESIYGVLSQKWTDNANRNLDKLDKASTD